MVWSISFSCTLFTSLFASLPYSSFHICWWLPLFCIIERDLRAAEENSGRSEGYGRLRSKEIPSLVIFS
jgi:hypothetical protein